MTRKEVLNFRDLIFSSWVREKLPDSSTGFSASDLDFLLWNWKEKKLMLLEIKKKNAVCRPGQRIMWKDINRWISKGIDDDWNYSGFHLIQFENTDFTNGKVYFDGKEVTEEELIKILSL